MKIRNNGKEPNLPRAHTCYSLNNSCHFHIHLFITFGDHISSADDHASFRGCSETGVIYFSGKKGVHPLPLVAENRRRCLEDPSDPCPFLGSVTSRGGTTSPCNEETSGFTPRFWSGQHMHNQLIFFQGSLLGGVGRVANPVAYV